MNCFTIGLFHLSEVSSSFGRLILESNLLNLILLDASLFYLLGAIVSEKLEIRIGRLLRRYLKFENERRKVRERVKLARKISLIWQEIGIKSRRDGLLCESVRGYPNGTCQLVTPVPAILPLWLKKLSYLVRVRGLYRGHA